MFLSLQNTSQITIWNPKSLDRANIQYINRTILDEFFSDYLIINPDKSTLEDFLKSNTVIGASFFENKEIYHLDTIKNFPEYLQTMKFYGLDGKLYEHEMADRIKKERIEYEKNKVKNLHYISDIAATIAKKLF